MKTFNFTNLQIKHLVSALRSYISDHEEVIAYMSIADDLSAVEKEFGVRFPDIAGRLLDARDLMDSLNQERAQKVH